MKVTLRKIETVDGRVIESLCIGKTYEVIGIEADDYRIVDDKGEPIVFDRTCFDVVIASEPDCWVSIVDDGVRYAYPPEWMTPGFFERFFDYDEDLRRDFWAEHHRYFPDAAHD